MARYLWCVPILLLVAAGAGDGTPVKGARTMEGVRIAPGRTWSSRIATKAAAGLASSPWATIGRPVNIGIVVYDEANQRVTEDQGIDYAAVIWYPPRSAKYKVVVSNSGAEYNEIYLVFK